MSEPVEGHVRETDAFTLRMERDPLLRSTITAITVFDRTGPASSSASTGPPASSRPSGPGS